MHLKIPTTYKLFGTLVIGGFATIMAMLLLPFVKILEPTDFVLTIGYVIVSIVMIIISIGLMRKL